MGPTLRWVLVGVAAFFAAAVVLAGAFVATVMPGVPSAETLLEVRLAEPSVLLSTDGKPLATYRRAKHERVSLDQVSPVAIRALIATEDRNFFEHGGIDLRRTFIAALKSLAGDVQGGSTLTQQLARNMFPEEIGRERSLKRKVREMIAALRIERVYSKQKILETYLNTVPFLYNVVGIEMAARTYYDKSAAELDTLEAATLVGMLKGSRMYNPVVNPDRSFERRNVVLASMVAVGLMTEEEQRALRDKPLQVRFNRDVIPTGPAAHFAEHVRKWLIQWADNRDYDIYADGLVVHTTIDASLQEAAVAALGRQAGMLQTIADVEWAQPSARVAATVPEAYAKLRGKAQPFEHFWKTHDTLLQEFIAESPEFVAARKAGATHAAALAKLHADSAFLARLRAAKTRLEAGFVAIDPTSGEVRAWVGSRDFKLDQFDHVVQAERQPGSTFKPFVYGAALEHGIPPSHTYTDEVVEFRLADGKAWRPTDMSRASGESMTLREGLIKSKNTITVQVMRDVGVPGVVRLAQAMGVDRSKLDPVPSLALGTSPVTLLEMVSSYSTIAAAGEYRKPIMVKRIVDRHGKVLADFGATDSRRAMSERSALELIDIMRGVITQGTGTAIKNRFGIAADLGGKTGTTQRNSDGWFIAMHPRLVAGAWIGFNDTRVTMRSSYWGQGGHNAIFIVGDFLKTTLGRQLDANAQFPRPLPKVVVAEAPAQGESGEPASAGSDPAFTRLVRDPVFGSSGRPAKTAEEVGRILEGMGREPETGRVASFPLPAPPPLSARPAFELPSPRPAFEQPSARPAPEPPAPRPAFEPSAPRTIDPPARASAIEAPPPAAAPPPLPVATPPQSLRSSPQERSE
jgi:penicillin-binding protein 1A